MTDTIDNVSRELLERLANSRAFLHDTRKAQDELRTLLAQPAARVTEELRALLATSQEQSE